MNNNVESNSSSSISSIEACESNVTVIGRCTIGKNCTVRSTCEQNFSPMTVVTGKKFSGDFENKILGTSSTSPHQGGICSHALLERNQFFAISSPVSTNNSVSDDCYDCILVENECHIAKNDAYHKTKVHENNVCPNMSHLHSPDVSSDTVNWVENEAHLNCDVNNISFSLN